MVLRFISSVVFPHKCPFCSERLTLNNQGTFYCTKCQTNFVEEDDEEGEGTSLEPYYPANVHQASGTQRATHFHPLLCQPCNNHQSIIVQLLSAYSDERGKSSNSENWEQEYKRYKGELERRYPLCMACRVAVSERLKQQDFRLRSFTSPGQLDKNARRVIANSLRRADYRLPVLFASLLYIGVMYLLESRNYEDLRVVILLSFVYLSLSFVFKTFLLSVFSVVSMSLALYSQQISIQVPQEFLNLHVRCISAITLSIVNLAVQTLKRMPKMRVQKAVSSEERFNLSLNDEKDENAQFNSGRNPFFSKTLLNSSIIACTAAKSMPTSPLYTNKFNAPSLKPTALSFKATSTGLENDFLESFSLSENNTSRPRNNMKTQSFHFLPFLDLLMRLGVVYLRFLVIINAPFQALIFAAAYSLFCNLDSGLHKRMPKTSRYLISLICALRFVWLGMDIGQPGWSADLDNKLNFPREYLSFGLDAFLLVFFSPK